MEKQQVFYIHGGDAYSKRGDFLESLKTREIRTLPWTEPLKKWTGTFVEDLGEEYEVFKPSMPCADNAKYDEWKIWFERHFEYLRDDIILVGWSQGGYFFAKYLTENDFPFTIKALFLLAAPLMTHNDNGEDGADFQFDYEKVGELTNKTDRIYIYHSKDDPIVPYDQALKYKELLPGAELVTFEDKNHFLIEEFPELLEKIREVS
ncbi:alpha/beta hydrolase [Candidatus Kaiserbacteria bacterium]|nr:alpha/beta hydrolase [Candidatus Kaiserbacteria bacterium]MCB9812357.1 alpha/beta hydrolase [Candidatus Nomurabacteria bacterium]